MTLSLHGYVMQIESRDQKIALILYCKVSFLLKFLSAQCSRGITADSSAAFSLLKQAQRKSLAKRNADRSFAVCGRRRGLRALDRATFEKVDETFSSFAAVAARKKQDCKDLAGLYSPSYY